jgi:hypothetical protein
VANQHVFNDGNGVSPGPGLYHVMRDRSLGFFHACGGIDGSLVESVEDHVMSLMSMVRLSKKEQSSTMPTN